MLEELLETAKLDEPIKKPAKKWRNVYLVTHPSGIYFSDIGARKECGDKYFGVGTWPSFEVAEMKALESLDRTGNGALAKWLTAQEVD